MSLVSDLFPFYDSVSRNRLINPEFLPNGVIIADAARGAKPKTWYPVLLRPCPTNHSYALPDGYVYGGSGRKGQGHRWAGLIVVDYWDSIHSLRGEMGFPTLELARDFLKLMGITYG